MRTESQRSLLKATIGILIVLLFATAVFMSEVNVELLERWLNE